MLLVLVLGSLLLAGCTAAQQPRADLAVQPLERVVSQPPIHGQPASHNFDVFDDPAQHMAAVPAVAISLTRTELERGLSLIERLNMWDLGPYYNGFGHLLSDGPVVTFDKDTI